MRELEDGIYLTPQEHRFIASTVSERYMSSPYVPIAVQIGCDITKVREIRKNVGSIDTLSILWEGDGAIEAGYTVPICLEELNDKGETIRDPTLVNPGFRLKQTKREKLLMRS